MTKRLFDIVFSFLVLTILSPCLLVIACAIKVGSRGPVFYRGRRVGWHGKRFHILKFRSMVIDADAGCISTADDDPRITSIGRFLRRYKLDEFPQFINVFVGQMSVVGPRPQVEWAVDLYTPQEQPLLDVKPGITDYASLVFRDEGAILKGSTDPDRDYLEKIAPEKIRLGLEYVHCHSLLVDAKIIMATIGAMIGRDPTWCLPAKPAVAAARIPEMSD